LCGGFAQGWRKRGNAREVARAEASIVLILEGWGQDNPAASQMFTSLIIPDATREEAQWLNARLVPLEGKNHLILSHEPAFPRFVEEICGFLDEDETASLQWLKRPLI
jgi:hypothetical protein